MALVLSSNVIANGVYVPAMSKKMVEWSSPTGRPSHAGDQVPRW